MRYRIYTYLHLVIMAFYILRPVIPYIDYAINKDYIASNLCINKDTPQSSCEGKCYLEKKITESAESKDSNDKNTPKKVHNELVNEFLNSLAIHINVFESPLIHAIRQDVYTPVRYLNAIFIPPR